MLEVIEGHLYDYPTYYDLVFGSDWKAEFNFLEACFAKHTNLTVKRLFEPACGTGRLMVKLAQRGYTIAGNDLNSHAVQFCNERLQRRDFPPSAFVGDMCDFTVQEKYDAAFNMINSFRHVQTEQETKAHLQCIANGLKTEGLYLLGLHLTPTEGTHSDEERWTARRGNLVVNSHMWSEGVDMQKRIEQVGMTFDVYTLTKHFRIQEQMPFRTYTADQMTELIASVPELQLVETYDFVYEIDHPITINSQTEDVVYVLKKT